MWLRVRQHGIIFKGCAQSGRRAGKAAAEATLRELGKDGNMPGSVSRSVRSLNPAGANLRDGEDTTGYILFKSV